MLQGGGLGGGLPNDAGSGGGGGGLAAVGLLLKFQDGAAEEADFVFIPGVLGGKLHLVVLRVAVVVLHPAVAVGHVPFGEPGVGQGGGLGGLLADVGGAAGGALGGLDIVGIPVHHGAGGGVDVAFKAAAAPGEGHLVNLPPLIPGEVDAAVLHRLSLKGGVLGGHIL